MKLWQKTFLFSSLLCTAVLYLCVFCITLPSVRAAVRGAREAGVREERVIAGALNNTVALVSESRQESAIGAFLAYYARTGLLFKVAQDGRVIYDTLGADAPAEPGRAGFARIGGTMLLYVTDLLPTGYTLVYAKPAAAETALIRQQTCAAVLSGTGVALALCVSLYVLMRRINLPVSRLAHELRTPLTVMRGYAETLKNARLTEEQRYQATSYIIAESRRLTCNDLFNEEYDLRGIPYENMGGKEYEDYVRYVLGQTFGQMCGTVKTVPYAKNTRFARGGTRRTDGIRPCGTHTTDFGQMCGTVKTVPYLQKRMFCAGRDTAGAHI